MVEANIPVDLFNPGQVFACLGFLEAAEVLLGGAEGGFDWSDRADVRFRLVANGNSNPFESALSFLANATVQQYAPIGFADTPAKITESASNDDDLDEGDAPGADARDIAMSETFPAETGDTMSLPVLLKCNGHADVALGHWADGSSRDTFKLYSGNRSAEKVVRAMLIGTRHKPRTSQTIGDLKTRGISQLWGEQRQALIDHPFHVLTPLGGSFNFDPRGAWTAIDAGYSLDQQKHPVASSPVVQILAAWGLEHVRPCELGLRQIRYAAWCEMLPTILARVAIQGHACLEVCKVFRFVLALNGKNKVVTFSQLEATP